MLRGLAWCVEVKKLLNMRKREQQESRVQNGTGLSARSEKNKPDELCVT